MAGCCVSRCVDDYGTAIPRSGPRRWRSPARDSRESREGRRSRRPVSRDRAGDVMKTVMKPRTDHESHR
jgi:hypothetical protein